ncbi:GNAT family N-acetyltransferase [Bacteriovoracaceae bacterium]|nr:GNAT family N-acetyltransferase [Bacteriovoracaceae bacterium]
MNNSPRIETERLLLTWPNDEQINQYYNDILNSNMFDTILWDGPEGESDLPDYWKNAKLTNPNEFEQKLSFAIIKKDSHEYIGGCDYRPVGNSHFVVDIGFALAPKFHNQGFATEAIKGLVHEAFQRRGAIRVCGTVFVGNTPSRRVFEKLDFTLEGTLRGVAYKRGEWLDEWMMGIIKNDWKNSEVYKT